MTLSLDDVRNKRFRIIPRKPGYETGEVDDFVDEVEETLRELVEENQHLKRQVDSLQSSPAEPQAVAAPSVTREEIVVNTGQEASSAVVRLVQMATEQAERLVAEATAESERIRSEATRDAETVTAEASGRAEELEANARSRAEQLESETTARADRLSSEIERQRAEMFQGLEHQRDELATAIEQLRAYEAAFRSNLTSQLRRQIEALESLHAEPTDLQIPDLAAPQADPASDSAEHRHADPEPPAVEQQAAEEEEQQDEGDSPRAASDTPRLDALLGDQR